MVIKTPGSDLSQYSSINIWNKLEAVKNNNLDAANKISKFIEDDVEVIVADNTNNETSEGSAVNSSSQGYLPDIRFDRQNPHSLSTSSLLGIGD